MGRGSVSSKFFVILTTLYTFLGVALIGFSAWFYIKIKELIKLRNYHDFALDTTMYWPQVLPWMYASIGVIITLISCFAFLGVAKKSRAVILTHITFQVLTLSALIAAAAVTITCADSEHSENFISEVVKSAFELTKHEQAQHAKDGFAELEKSLQCCGPDSYTSYGQFSKFATFNLSTSCCDSFDPEIPVKVCMSSDKTAMSRPGCIDVAVLYVKIYIKMFAAGAILTAIFGLLGLISAVCFSKGLLNRKKESENGVQRKSNLVCAAKEFELEKVPLKV